MAYQERKSEDLPKELFILSGELRGVSVPLTGDDIRLGSSSDCDVVLLDEAGEDPSEAVISSGEDGSYVFESVAGSVRIGRRNLKPGNSRSVSKDVSIVVGNVEMGLASSLESADDLRHSYRRQASSMAWAASIAVGLSLLGFWSYSGGLGSVEAKALPVTQITFLNDGSGGNESMVAAKELKQHLDEVGLLKLDIVGDQAERMVTVMGELKESDRARWLETFEWFDHSYGKSVYLDAKFSTVEDEITLPFSIQAVWVGSVPRVTLHDGTKRTVGDELPGGWVLDAVAQNSVTISKDDETLDVAL